MTVRRILTIIFAAFILAEARVHDIDKRETNSLCDSFHITKQRIQCYCTKGAGETKIIRSADCYLTHKNVTANDHEWENFSDLKDAYKITLTNSRGVALTYIPTKIFQYTNYLKRIDVKYGATETIEPFAFGNLTVIEEIMLGDNQIKLLKANAFAHHKSLKIISLDKNNIVEINRDVFIDLPVLETLFLTSNKITTIHDRAFTHLRNLKELEINMNNLFSMNSETFSGLRKLQKLDLNANNLEVIGDNTFLPLQSLRVLLLEGNKIQMLDDKAFNGLNKLHHLDLSHNKISEITSDKVFEDLVALISLNLKGNMLKELKSQVMAPILRNFYDVLSVLDVDDNDFPCTCQLDWFLSLMNKTQSRKIKISIENFKCVPDPALRESWIKVEESEKSSGQTFEDDGQNLNADYEYYDETQLNGKLFYTDVRYLLNCSGPNYDIVPRLKPVDVIVTTAKPNALLKNQENRPNAVTSTSGKPIVTTTIPTIPKKHEQGSSNKVIRTHKDFKEIEGQGLLDIYIPETTAKSATVKTNEANIRTDFASETKPNLYTTSRLATVSANPIENRRSNDEGMASDEAKPDATKAHESVSEEFKDVHPPKGSDAHRGAGCALLLIVCLRFLY